MFVVPYYSQYLDVKNLEWKTRSCGIVALKMILDYWKTNSVSFDDLIETGIKLDAYIDGIGWKHNGLVKIAEKYGFQGKNFDWFGDLPVVALEKMKKYLTLYPMMASVHRNFDERESGHLIVLTGLKDDEIFYNEPAAQKREDIARKVSVTDFLKGWKRRIIVVYPNEM